MGLTRKQRYAQKRMKRLRANPKWLAAFRKHNREWARKYRQRPERMAYQRDYHRRKRLKLVGRRKRCEICGRVRKLVLDHSHDFALKHCSHPHILKSCSRCRRGALCYGCNVGIAMIEKHEKKAGQYLRRWHRILNRRTNSN